MSFVPRGLQLSSIYEVAAPSQDASSTSSSPQPQIIIPKRKKRDELSILKALDHTVKMNPRTAHYMYHDDPFMLPVQINNRRNYAAAKSAGRKAAQHVAKTYPQFLEVNPFSSWFDLQPVLKAFTPQVQFLHSSDTVDGLRERIDSRACESAYINYQLLNEKGEEIPNDVKLALFDLLCCYNSEDPKKSMYPEEKYIFHEGLSKEQKSEVMRRVFVKTWKDKGPAEEIFAATEKPSHRMYNSLLRGRVKYHQVEMAYKLYLEMKERNIRIDGPSYTAVLSIDSSLSEPGKWKEVLQHMSDSGVKPTVRSFNAILKSIVQNKVRHGSNGGVMDFLEIFDEMKILGIEPTLASWLSFLQYIGWDDYSNLRHEILDSLQGKDFTMQDPDDAEFFFSMMFLSNVRYKDMSFAYKVHNLMMHGQNYLLLGSSNSHGLYFINFLRLILTHEPLGTFMKYWDELVPFTVTPRRVLLDELLECIEINESYDVLLRIWADVKDTILSMDSALSKYIAVMNSIPTEQLLETHLDILSEVTMKFQNEQSNRFRPFRLNGQTVGNIIHILLKVNDEKQAWDLFTMYYQSRSSITGFPGEDALAGLAQLSIRDNNFTRLKQTLGLMNTVCYASVDGLINEAYEKMELSDGQSHELRTL